MGWVGPMDERRSEATVFQLVIIMFKSRNNLTLQCNYKVYYYAFVTTAKII